MPAKKRTRRTGARRNTSRKARTTVRGTAQNIRGAAAVEKAYDEVGTEGRKMRRSALSNVYRKVREIERRDIIKTYEQVREKASSLMKVGQERLHILSSQVLLMTEMLRDHWNNNHELPWKSVAAITAAVMYFLGPFDIIPDFIPGIGLIDDFVVIGLCFRVVQADLREYAAEKNIDLSAYGLHPAR
jgi:uncharacterized membrane protein YkvA (DUF1232 family)